MEHSTYTYSKENCYGYNPANSAYITSQIKGDELENLGITLEITTGHINGCVNEYDEQSIIKDTIRVMYHDTLFGFIRINSDELLLPLKYGYKVSDFNYITFANYNLEGYEEHADLIQAFVKQLPTYYTTTGIGLHIRSFLTICTSDLEFSKNIIINRFKDLFNTALNITNTEKNDYIYNIKSKYFHYM